MRKSGRITSANRYKIFVSSDEARGVIPRGNTTLAKVLLSGSSFTNQVLDNWDVLRLVVSW